MKTLQAMKVDADRDIESDSYYVDSKTGYGVVEHEDEKEIVREVSGLEGVYNAELLLSLSRQNLFQFFLSPSVSIEELTLSTENGIKTTTTEPKQTLQQYRSEIHTTVIRGATVKIDGYELQYTTGLFKAPDESRKTLCEDVFPVLY